MPVDGRRGARFAVLRHDENLEGTARGRGFDQAELLARAVARRLGVPWAPVLVRLPGPPQTGRPPGVLFPYGLFEWTLIDVRPVGAAVQVSIAFPLPVTLPPQYWKVDALGVWTRLQELLLKSRSDVLRARLQKMNPTTDPGYEQLFSELVALDGELRRLRAGQVPLVGG